MKLLMMSDLNAESRSVSSGAASLYGRDPNPNRPRSAVPSLTVRGRIEVAREGFKRVILAICIARA